MDFVVYLIAGLIPGIVIFAAYRRDGRDTTPAAGLALLFVVGFAVLLTVA